MVKPIDRMGADLAQRTSAVMRAPEKARRQTVTAAAAAGKEEQVKVLRRDSGGDLVLSGVGSKGARIGASYKLDLDGAGATIRATGPVPLLANPTKGRVIRSRHARGRRRRGFIGPAAPGQFGGGRRAVLNIPGIGYRRSARHPGTKGKDSWDRGKRQAKVAIRRELGRHTDRVVVQAFRRGG